MAEKRPLTVTALWKSFAAAVLVPERIGPETIQWSEMRRAFYAGFFSALCTMRDIPGHPDVSEEEGVAILQALHDECLDF